MIKKIFKMKFSVFATASLMLEASIILGVQADLHRRGPICFIEGRCIER